MQNEVNYSKVWLPFLDKEDNNCIHIPYGHHDDMGTLRINLKNGIQEFFEIISNMPENVKYAIMILHDTIKIYEDLTNVEAKDDMLNIYTEDFKPRMSI